MQLIPSELLVKRDKQATPPPPDERILKQKGHSLGKWTQVSLFQDPYLKSEKKIREPFPVPY
jgi:hypothetical protein